MYFINKILCALGLCLALGFLNNCTTYQSKIGAYQTDRDLENSYASNAFQVYKQDPLAFCEAIDDGNADKAIKDCKAGLTDSCIVYLEKCGDESCRTFRQLRNN